MSIFRLYHDSATGMWRLEVRQNNNKTAEVIVKTQKRMQQEKQQQQQKYQNICSSDKVFPPVPQSLKNSSIYALTSTDDYPFGRRKWEVHNDVDCGGGKREDDK